MTDDEIAKALLVDRNCDNCRYNGKFARINYMMLDECHYWLQTQRSHEKALNPPPTSNNQVCKFWESIIIFK